MTPVNRRQVIMNYLKSYKEVDVDDLARQLDVSSMTIRRDLAQLETEGKLIRTHGGAVLPQPLVRETSYITKETAKLEQKREIAKKAVSFIESGQSIILDSGTTTLEIAKLLNEFNDLVIITNDIHIASFLLNSTHQVMITGGQLQKDIGTIYGHQTSEFLKNIFVDTLFIGSSAIDNEAGLTSPTNEKSIIKQIMIQSAEKSFLVADSSKLDTKSLYKIANLEEISGFITDDSMTIEQRNKYSNHIKVI